MPSHLLGRGDRIHRPMSSSARAAPGGNGCVGTHCVLCRYALRSPVGQNRPQRTPDGKAVLELRRQWTDGATQLHPGLVFGPAELLERLAALTPSPRVNLVLCHGMSGRGPRGLLHFPVVNVRHPAPTRLEVAPEPTKEQPWIVKRLSTE